jgi:hypothetical protein
MEILINFLNFIFLLFLSGERTSFFILNFSFLIFILLSKDFKKMRLFMLSSSFLLIFIISIFKPTSAQRMIYQTLQQIGLVDLAYTFSKNYKIITNNDLNFLSGQNQFIWILLAGGGTNIYENKFEILKNKLAITTNLSSCLKDKR